MRDPSPCEFEQLLQSISIPRILLIKLRLAWNSCLILANSSICFNRFRFHASFHKIKVSLGTFVWHHWVSSLRVRLRICDSCGWDPKSFCFQELTNSIFPSPCEFEPLLQSISIPRILSQNQLLAWSNSLNFHAARHSVNLRDSCEVLLESNSIFLFRFILQSKLASHSRHRFTNLCRICRLLQESCAAVLVTAMDDRFVRIPKWIAVRSYLYSFLEKC